MASMTPEAAFLSFIQKEPDDVLQTLDVNADRGLDDSKVHARLRQWGNNQLASEQTTKWDLLLRQVKSPFMYILATAAVLAFVLGEYLDGSFILLFIIINTILGFGQEYRSEKSIQALKKLTRTHARVLRNKTVQLIDSSQVVPGDIIVLEPGDIVQADARIIEVQNLLVNESVLTGESQVISKTPQGLLQTHVQPHEATNILFSGTSIISGHAKAVVCATGIRAYLGDISRLTAQTVRISSFEKSMAQFSQFVLRIVAVTLVAVVVGNFVVKGGQTNFWELVLFSIALAASVIPEALPLVITFSLSRGAMALARQHVIIKRLSAIEDLGAINVLCTDKTGTITQNKLEVSDIWGNQIEKTLTLAAFASPPEDEHPDPFDIAISQGIKTKKIDLPQYEQRIHLPFDPERRRNSYLIHSNDKNILIVRGAPEVIAQASQLDSEQKQALKNWIKEQGTHGHRVLAVGTKQMPATTKNYTAEDESCDLEFVGCISFTDPLKPSTQAAISKAMALGVQIKILTGDSPEVAGNVAQKIGLIGKPSEVILAEKLETLSGKQLRKALTTHHVFARVSPQQKHWIIEQLKEFSQVGFLGEGINDAPALKAAHVSLVVQGASDIAREAADIILTKSDLEVIIDGIHKGRVVFANTIKYIKITLAANFGNFYAVAIASLIIDFLPMLPIQILLVNLLSDLPMIAIATDSVDDEELAKPEGYNMRDFALIATFMGLVSTVFDFIFFAMFFKLGASTLQTNWFIASILTELAFVFSMRTKRVMLRAKMPSLPIILLTAGAALLAITITFIPWGIHVFHFQSPSTGQLTAIFSMTIAYVMTTEVTKFFYYRYFTTESKK